MSDNPLNSRRLIVVTETYPPEINGVANTMFQLVRRLRRFGHQVWVIRPRQVSDRPSKTQTDQPVEDLLVPGVPIPGYRGLRFGLAFGGQLRSYCDNIRPHAFYVATQGPLGRSALNCARHRGIPALTGFHTQFHQYSRYYGLGLLMRPIVSSLRRFHNRANATLVPTAALQAELGGAGFKNVRVFSRGVDTELFAPERRSRGLRQSWGCGDDCLVVLYVGRLAPEKNINLAFAAFVAIADTGMNCKFVLVGDGPERERLTRQHPDYVFAGARVGKDLATHYASADLFLFPSLTETFGNVVPEAMASALPVLAFDYAAAAQHMRAGSNGMTVPVDDAAAFLGCAVDLARNRTKLQELGRAARRSAAALSWDSVIRDVERIILDLTERNMAAEKTDASIVATSD